MSNEFYTILTDAGLAAIANASVSSSTVNFTKVLVGDSNGSYYTPTKEMTALRNKKWEGPVASVEIDPNNPNWVSVDAVVPATEGGFYIREIGIANDEGVLLAIGKLPETYKPALDSGSTKDLYLRAIFEVSNASVINLRTDPSVVLASRKFVEDKVAVVSGNLTTLQNDLNLHLEQYEYQVPTINGTQIQLEKQSNSNRLLFKLESDLSGSVTISTDEGATSKNLVDIDGAPVTSIEKGFHEIILTGNFFILRNKGGLSKADLEALITINNEAEANESVLRTNYVNAVNASDDSINLPAEATWNDILMQVPNINTSRKRFKTGSFVKTGEPSHEVTDLPFTPSMGFLWCYTGSVYYRWALHEDSERLWTTDTQRFSDYAIQRSNSFGAYGQYPNALVPITNGFRLTSTVITGHMINYIMIE